MDHLWGVKDNYPLKPWTIRLGEVNKHGEQNIRDVSQKWVWTQFGTKLLRSSNPYWRLYLLIKTSQAWSVLWGQSPAHSHLSECWGSAYQRYGGKPNNFCSKDHWSVLLYYMLLTPFGFHCRIFRWKKAVKRLFAHVLEQLRYVLPSFRARKGSVLFQMGVFENRVPF
jgi:hypothetical protein